MKCYACGKVFPLTAWRELNLDSSAPSDNLRNRLPTRLKYYATSGSKSQYNRIYACPHCGTLRVRTPIDKN